MVSYRRISSQSLLGVLVVLVGLVLLLNTTGVYDTEQLLVYAPGLFVLLGVYALVASRFHNLVGPVIVVLVAGAWQLVALGYVAGDVIGMLWPLVIVAFGLSVLAGRMRSRATPVDGSFLSSFAMFGGVEKRATSQSFTGADVTALFGGAELDLRDVDVTSPPARVNATALFGGVDVVVPRDWNVQVDVLPILGAAEDDRPRSEVEHDAVDLVVTGFAAFGAVSVSN